MISNFILAKFKQPHVIVTNQHKADYIDALKQSAKHQDASILTALFAGISMERMENEIQQKRNLTQNFEINFKPKQ